MKLRHRTRNACDLLHSRSVFLTGEESSALLLSFIYLYMMSSSCLNAMDTLNILKRSRILQYPANNLIVICLCILIESLSVFPDVIRNLLHQIVP